MTRHRVAVVAIAEAQWETFMGMQTTARGVVTCALLAVDIVVVALTVVGVGGPIRMAAGLVFSLAVPGWAFVVHLDLRWPAAEIALTLGTSLALLMMTAQAMLTLGAWQPKNATYAVGLLAGLLLAAHLIQPSKPAVKTG